MRFLAAQHRSEASAAAGSTPHKVHECAVQGHTNPNYLLCSRPHKLKCCHHHCKLSILCRYSVYCAVNTGLDKCALEDQGLQSMRHFHRFIPPLFLTCVTQRNHLCQRLVGLQLCELLARGCLVLPLTGQSVLELDRALVTD